MTPDPTRSTFTKSRSRVRLAWSAEVPSVALSSSRSTGEYVAHGPARRLRMTKAIAHAKHHLRVPEKAELVSEHLARGGHLEHLSHGRCRHTLCSSSQEETPERLASLQPGPWVVVGSSEDDDEGVLGDRRVAAWCRQERRAFAYVE